MAIASLSEAFVLPSVSTARQGHVATARPPFDAAGTRIAAAPRAPGLSDSWTAAAGLRRPGGHGLLCAVASTLVASAAAAMRRGRPKAWSRVPCHVSMTREQIVAAQMRAEQVEETIERATFVPETFEDAIAQACKATMSAVAKGNRRQFIYFDAGDGDSDVSGDFGRVLPFAEAYAKALAAIKAAEGGKVRVIFNDMGGKSICENRWAPLPPGLVLDYFPPMAKNQSAEDTRIRMKLEEAIDSDVIITVTTSQAEVEALLTLLDLMKNRGTTVPMILVNAKLVTDSSLAAGRQLKQIVAFDKSLLTTFHLEQVDPPDEAGLNSAVVCRVWPRPYSVWEDNPDDPEAVDGFFLLDVSDTEPPSPKEIRDLLKTSQELAQPSLPPSRL